MKDEKDTKENIPEEEDDVVEYVFNDDGEEDLKATLKKLRADLKEARKEKEEYLANWQKERADFINYKKDELARLGNAGKYAQEKFVEGLLPVLDAYDMAFANKEAWEKVDKNWRMGVEYIHQQLLKALADNGVVPVTASPGMPLDPTLHESIGSIETNDPSQDHTIAEVVQSGYKGGEKVIRPARVKVFSLQS